MATILSSVPTAGADIHEFVRFCNEPDRTKAVRVRSA